MEVSTEQLLQIIGTKQVQIETLQAQLRVVSEAYTELKKQQEAPLEEPKKKYEPEGGPSETDQPAEA